MGKKSSEPSARKSKVDIVLCSECHELEGRNYPSCQSCTEQALQPIRLAWQDLLTREKITAGSSEEQSLVANILEASDQYWWSEVEAAMRLTLCPACAGPLGYGEPGCEECIWRSDMLWGKDLKFAEDGTMARNDHPLRVVLRGLGQSHRHSTASLIGWRLYLPFLLKTSYMPTTQDTVKHAQAINAWIKAGKGAELFQCHSIEEMYALTRPGRNNQR